MPKCYHKKAHKHELFGPVAMGTIPELSQGGTNLEFALGQLQVCPWDQTKVFTLFYTTGSQVCPWHKPGLSLGQTGVEQRQRKLMCLKQWAGKSCFSDRGLVKAIVEASKCP